MYSMSNKSSELVLSKSVPLCCSVHCCYEFVAVEIINLASSSRHSLTEYLFFSHSYSRTYRSPQSLSHNHKKLRRPRMPRAGFGVSAQLGFLFVAGTTYALERMLVIMHEHNMTCQTVLKGEWSSASGARKRADLEMNRTTMLLQVAILSETFATDIA